MFPSPHDQAHYAKLKHSLWKGLTPAEFGLDYLRQIEVLETTRTISAALPTMSDIQQIVVTVRSRVIAAARSAAGRLRDRANARS